jgi:Solute carrier family 35
VRVHHRTSKSPFAASVSCGGVQFFNLSLLTSDFMSALARLFLFDGFSRQSATSFAVSCIVVVTGLVLYNTAEMTSSRRQVLGSQVEGAIAAEYGAWTANMALPSAASLQMSDRMGAAGTHNTLTAGAAESVPIDGEKRAQTSTCGQLQSEVDGNALSSGVLF